MTYVISDLNGNLAKFRALTEKLSLADDDVLYVLGDSADYGEQTVELLTDMSMRANVYPVAGDHDFTALKMLTGFEKMLKSGATPDPEFAADMMAWAADGGKVTLDGYRALDEEMREGILDYLSEFSLFEEATVNGKDYVLVHAGIGGFDPALSPDEYEPEDFFVPAKPGERFYPGKTLIVGGAPTGGKIEREEGLIRINCGLRETGVLGCLCLETGEEIYV